MEDEYFKNKENLDLLITIIQDYEIAMFKLDGILGSKFDLKLSEKIDLIKN